MIGAATLLAAATLATADEFDVENLHLVSPGDGELLSVNSTRQLPGGLVALGVSLGLADDPLVVVDMNDDRVADVIHRRVGAELGAAYGFGRIEVSAAVPLILYQNAAPNMEAGLAGVDSGGLGDLRLTGRGALLGGADGPGVGAGLTVSLPTSVNAEFGGESGPTASPFLVADWRTDRAVAAVNAGARVRDEATIGDLSVGSAFTYGAGGAVRAGSSPIWVLAELAGEVGGSDAAEAPLELRGGLRADLGSNLLATAAYGRGLVHGYGAPDHRFLAAVTYRPAAARTAERIQIAAVAPVEPPPNPDPDRDGILGAADACPDDAEDFDGFEDQDGCPETDNDRDGIADKDDHCMNAAEDLDAHEDGDGCPDPDNDFDGIADKDDRCPDQSEVINGNQDDDGCPDEGKRLVLIGKNKLEIQDKVYFANGKADILPRSSALLDQIAKTLERHAWIRKLRIEGHTDDRGTDEYNLDLSKRRAESVRAALIQRHVVESRLEAVGYGEGQPIDNNKTLEGRAHNRRVEFVITDQEGERPLPDAGTTGHPGGGAR